MAAAAVQPVTFRELSASVTKFIKEEAKTSNGSSVITATHLLIAIENAANIFKDCPPDQQPSLNAKVGDFMRMIAALRKTDYCSLNLPACIQHSIDTCTSDSSKPLVYSTYPQHIVPGLEVTVEVFGKFKYANKAKYGDTYLPTLHFGEQTFEPITTDSHTLKFTLSFSDVASFLKAHKCSHLDVKLVVPYEVGYLGMIKANRSRFVFNFPIRALPINAGVIDLTFKRINDQLTKTVQLIMGWSEPRVITLDPATSDKFTFTSFDGQKQEFTAKDLDAEVKASKKGWFIKKTIYLTMSTYPSAKGQDPHSWRLIAVPPAGL